MPPKATKADFVPVKDSSEQVVLDMLGDELAAAVVAARGRLQDSSIMCRIGEVPGGVDPEHGYPPGFVPGLVSIHRDGAETVYDLSHENALAGLKALT